MSLNSMRKSFHKSGKYILWFVGAAMLVTAFTGIGGIFGLGRNNMPTVNNPTDETVATVDGVPITRSQYDQESTQMRQWEAMSGPQSALMAGSQHTQALEELISNVLRVEVAQAHGVSATPADIAAARNQLLPRLRTMLSLPATASLGQVDSALTQHGMQSVEALYPDDVLKQQVIFQKYQQQQAASSAKLSDQDIRAFYRQSHVRHILIDNKKRSDVQAIALANHLIDKLKAGADFAQLARQYSDDPSVKLNSGDDGWIDQSINYDPEFKKAALSLSPGQLAPSPVKSPQFGYFIIQCLAVRDNLPKDYAKNKLKYASMVGQELQGQQEQTDLSVAQQVAKIVISDPQLRADHEMEQAQSADTSDPVKRNADLAAALADYQKALPAANFSSKGEIQVQMALIYEMQNQPDKELAALASAAPSTADPQIYILLGNLYRKKGDTKNALAQYAQASEQAYDNADIHRQLLSLYGQMREPQLVAKEQKWLADFQKQQTAMLPSQGAALAPGAKTVSVTVPAGHKTH